MWVLYHIPSLLYKWQFIRLLEWYTMKEASCWKRSSLSPRSQQWHQGYKRHNWMTDYSHHLQTVTQNTSSVKQITRLIITKNAEWNRTINTYRCWQLLSTRRSWWHDTCWPLTKAPRHWRHLMHRAYRRWWNASWRTSRHPTRKLGWCRKLSSWRRWRQSSSRLWWQTSSQWCRLLAADAAQTNSTTLKEHTVDKF